MQIYRAEHPMYLSNAYLVVDDEGGGVLVDGHGEDRELVDRVESEGIKVHAILLTHHHGDHVQLDNYAGLNVPVYASAETADLVDFAVDETLVDGEDVTFGGLTITPISTPGHARGHTALLINGTDVITADVLFKGTIGGSRAPDNTGFDDLKASVEKLLSLPDETRVHPGHKEPTTIADEKSNNVFVRALRGEEDTLDEPVKVGGQDATLLVWGPDYDGTNKAWVRFADGSQDVTGGSQVERSGG